MVLQWCVRVQKRDGERTRQELLDRGFLDSSLKPGKEGEDVLFPVTTWLEGSTKEDFEAHSAIAGLPRHELIGGIAVMQDRDLEEAERLLSSRPSIHTVLFPQSDVEGHYRTRRYEVLAGEPTTRTRYLEHGLRFDIDLSEAYFSARLSTERQRVLACMDEGERVLDMFAGVGPFAITLGAKARFVAASDINPGAVRLMVKNIALNHRENILPILCDASHLPAVLSWKFDRVVMNLPLGALPFLGMAVGFCRPGGTIHCYSLVEARGELLPAISQYPVSQITERYVRSYSPGRWHAVYDIVRKADPE